MWKPQSPTPKSWTILTADGQTLTRSAQDYGVDWIDIEVRRSGALVVMDVGDNDLEAWNRDAWVWFRKSA